MGLCKRSIWSDLPYHLSGQRIRWNQKNVSVSCFHRLNYNYGKWRTYGLSIFYMLYQNKESLLQKLFSHPTNCVCGAATAHNPISCCHHMVCIHWRGTLCLTCQHYSHEEHNCHGEHISQWVLLSGLQCAVDCGFPCLFRQCPADCGVCGCIQVNMHSRMQMHYYQTTTLQDKIPDVIM